MIISICKNLKSSVFCEENFRKTTKDIILILGGSKKLKLSKICNFKQKNELLTPKNPFFPPGTQLKISIIETALKKSLLSTMAHTRVWKFILLTIWDGVICHQFTKLDLFSKDSSSVSVSCYILQYLELTSYISI